MLKSTSNVPSHEGSIQTMQNDLVLMFRKMMRLIQTGRTQNLLHLQLINGLVAWKGRATYRIHRQVEDLAGTQSSSSIHESYLSIAECVRGLSSESSGIHTTNPFACEDDFHSPIDCTARVTKCYNVELTNEVPARQMKRWNLDDSSLHTVM